MLIFEIIVFNFACLYLIAAKWLNLLRPPKVYDRQKYGNLLKTNFHFIFFYFVQPTMNTIREGNYCYYFNVYERLAD